MKARRIAALVAGVLVLGYAAHVGRLYLRQDAIMFPGTKMRGAPQPPPAPGLEVLKVPTPGGEVEAFFLPATTASGTRQPVVLYAHGRSDLIDAWVHALDSFRARGIGVLLVEYPGYGRSTGTPSEASIRATMDAAYDRIAQDPRVDGQRLFGFGQSLGGAAICQLARDRALRALILESTFPSLDVLPASYGAPAFILHGHFDSLAVVSQFQGPVLVIHGRHDPLIPWQQAQALATAAPHGTFKLYDCGHGCWEPERLPFWQDAAPILRAAGVLPDAPPST